MLLNKECKRSFEDLKKAVINMSVLDYPDSEHPFILETDTRLIGYESIVTEN